MRYLEIGTRCKLQIGNVQTICWSNKLIKCISASKKKHRLMSSQAMLPLANGWMDQLIKFKFLKPWCVWVLPERFKNSKKQSSKHQGTSPTCHMDEVILKSLKSSSFRIFGNDKWGTVLVSVWWTVEVWLKASGCTSVARIIFFVLETGLMLTTVRQLRSN